MGTYNIMRSAQDGNVVSWLIIAVRDSTKAFCVLYACKGVEARDGRLGDEDGVVAVVDPEWLLRDLTKRVLRGAGDAKDGWE
jgi:hypothetical protein